MKPKIILIGLFSLFFFQVKAQDATEAVKSVVENYFQGYIEGDTSKLKEVFHEDFHLSWINPSRDRPFRQVDRMGLLAFFGPSWKTLTISAKLLDTKVYNESAYALADVRIHGQVIWTDHISLLKIKDRWWIVSKISEGRPDR